MWSEASLFIFGGILKSISFVYRITEYMEGTWASIWGIDIQEGLEKG